ncbi:MAG: Dabb family protein [Bryobacteraceae bacterium]
MPLSLNLKKALVAGSLLVALGAAAGLAANRYGKPKSVIHVVTLYYKDGTTEAQKKSVLDAVEKMASEVPGIKNVWLKSNKVQGVFSEKQPDGSFKPHPFTDAFVIEFEDQAAFDKYANHPAHKAFEAIYIPLRGRSSTDDITN